MSNFTFSKKCFDQNPTSGLVESEEMDYIDQRDEVIVSFELDKNKRLTKKQYEVSNEKKRLEPLDAIEKKAIFNSFSDINNMKKEVKILMDKSRNLYINDGENEYNFWVLGYGVPASFVIETDSEREDKKKKEKEREREERFEGAKRRYERENRSWLSKNKWI